MQRMQARDFYDIWYLLEIHKMDLAYTQTKVVWEILATLFFWPTRQKTQA